MAKKMSARMEKLVAARADLKLTLSNTRSAHKEYVRADAKLAVVNGKIANLKDAEAAKAAKAAK